MTSLRKSLTLSLTGTLVVVFLSFLAAVHFAVNKVARDQLLMHLTHDGNSLLSGISLDAHGHLQLLEASVEAVYRQPDSGHYYTITSPGETLASPSLAGIEPLGQKFAPGQHVIVRNVGDGQQKLLVLVRSLELHGRPIQLAVAEDLADLESEVRDQSVFILMLVVPGLILAVILQLYVVNRELAPLTRAEDELQRLGRGEIRHFEMTLPSEVQPLIDEVNRLLELVNRRLSQSRTAIGNLAHALKTPLAVLFRLADDPGLTPEARKALKDHAQIIHGRVETELKRARLAGFRQSGMGVQLRSELNELAAVLQAIYRDKPLKIDIVAPDKAFQYDREDLLELVGNLGDNACKWARAHVRIEASDTAQALVIRVADDGPGCPADERERMLKRGTRLDESLPGHGLGLAICREITDFYGGELRFDTDPVLGGLAVVATLPHPA